MDRVLFWLASCKISTQYSKRDDELRGRVRCTRRVVGEVREGAPARQWGPLVPMAVAADGTVGGSSASERRARRDTVGGASTATGGRVERARESRVRKKMNLTVRAHCQ